MPIEDFEDLVAVAPPHVRLEFVDGRVRTKDPLSVEDFEELAHEAPETVRLEYKGRAITDGFLAPVDHFRGHGNWSEADGALMAVEITSHDRDTNQRDRIDKPIGYAEADIPVYLLIDRDNNTVTVFSEPKDGRYQQSPSYPWGATVEIPSPVDITLDTEKLRDYAD
jgi:Uma2 family endonuclease